MLAIAAALIVFLGLFFNGGSPSNQEIYTDNSNRQELSSFVSRGETNANLLIAGESAFINKDYTTAIHNFSTYINNQTNVNPTALLYLGIAQLETNNTEAALTTFNKLIESKTLDQSKGYWYKALVYFKMDDRGNAIKMLESIAKDSKNFNYAKAQVLLKQLQM